MIHSRPGLVSFAPPCSTGASGAFNHVQRVRKGPRGPLPSRAGIFSFFRWFTAVYAAREKAAVWRLERCSVSESRQVKRNFAPRL